MILKFKTIIVEDIKENKLHPIHEDENENNDTLKTKEINILYAPKSEIPAGKWNEFSMKVDQVLPASTLSIETMDNVTCVVVYNDLIEGDIEIDL